MIAIREMTPGDWDDVRRIYRQAMDEGTSTFQTEVPPREAFDRAHLPDCRLVLTEDGRVAGWCTLAPVSQRVAYRGVAEVSIYLDRACRGRGLGTALLRALVAASEEKGYWSLFASVFSDNVASLRLHKGCGFREIGYRERIAQDRFGVWQNTTQLERRSAVNGCIKREEAAK